MLGIPSQAAGVVSALLGQAGGAPKSPEQQFGEIFIVFTILGTLVGIVVIGYTLLNAYKYRDGAGTGEKADVTRPKPGQIPSGSGGGKKLFLSFGISAFIVLSLVIWTYSALLYVETTPDEQEPDITVEVVGSQFSWQFIYPNGHQEVDTLVVPEDQLVKVEVSTADVFHSFGIPEFRVKADAMPGHTQESWFVPDETGQNFEAPCYELCGSGHSRMRANVTVLSQEEFEDWYAQTQGSDGGEGTAGNGTNETAAGNETETGNETTAPAGTGTESAAGNETQTAANGTESTADTQTPTDGNESAALAAPARLAGGPA